MVNMSAAMAATFVESAEKMNETIETLGLNPLRNGARDSSSQEGDRLP
jgi:hypothetical protein